MADLTILSNLSQIHQKGNQLGGFDDFDEFFAIFCYCMHFWTYFRKGWGKSCSKISLGYQSLSTHWDESSKMELNQTSSRRPGQRGEQTAMLSAQSLLKALDRKLIL